MGFAARRTLFDLEISCSITHGQRRAKSSAAVCDFCPACADRASSWSSSMISHDGAAFFSPRILRMVLFFFFFTRVVVFHALFVLKVGVCFLIGAKFSELCLWFWLVLVGYKMLVSLQQLLTIAETRVGFIILSCMYIEVHDLSSVFTKSVCTALHDECSWLLLTWHKSSRCTRYSNFFVCIRLKSYSDMTRNTKEKDHHGCHLIPLVYSCYCNLCVCERERERERERESHNENEVRDEQRARHKHFNA